MRDVGIIMMVVSAVVLVLRLAYLQWGQNAIEKADQR